MDYKLNSQQHGGSMSRRSFLGSAAIAAAGLSAGVKAEEKTETKSTKFELKYAPHFWMFKEHAGDDLVDQLKFIADQGFTAFEDNPMLIRPKDEQNRIAKAMSELGLEMGVFVGYGLWTPTREFDEKRFVGNKKEDREFLVKRMKECVEVAKRCNAKWMTVVPGSFDPGLEWDYQTANVVENLKWCEGVCEPAGLVMVLESLNPWKDHPGMFLSKIPQAYQICRAVNSPSCKILDDLYHQQVTEGNLIGNMEMAWEQIGYIQTGDNPGRKEPGTGEINYTNIFKWLHEKGYDGIIGMEHGNSMEGKAGEQAVIDAYRKCDSF
jgi:hydroxypyruvate isomerase